MTTQLKKNPIGRYIVLLFGYGLVACLGFLVFSIIFSPAPTISTSWQNAKSVTLRQATFVKNDDSRYSSDKYIVTGQDFHSQTLKYYTSTKPIITSGKLEGKVISANMVFTFGDNDYGRNLIYFEQSSNHYKKQVQLINRDIEHAEIGFKTLKVFCLSILILSVVFATHGILELFKL